MAFHPVSFKPLLFVPTTFNKDTSSGITSLDRYLKRNASHERPPAANIRGMLLNRAADADCPPTIRTDIQQFNQVCQILGAAPVPFPPTHYERHPEPFVSPSALQMTSPSIPAGPATSWDLTTTDGSDVGDDNIDEDDDEEIEYLYETHRQPTPEEAAEEMGSPGHRDSSSSSSSDDDDEDMDAYTNQIFNDTAQHHFQPDIQSGAPDASPAIFIDPFVLSGYADEAHEAITPEPFECVKSPEPLNYDSPDPDSDADEYKPSASSSPKKRRKSPTKPKSTPRKKARKTRAPVSPSSSSSSSNDYYGGKHNYFESPGASSSTSSNSNIDITKLSPGDPEFPFRTTTTSDGKVKYTCRTCNPPFSTCATGDMRRHMESLAHKPKKEHICRFPGCGSSFTRKDALKRHKTTQRHY